MKKTGFDISDILGKQLNDIKQTSEKRTEMFKNYDLATRVAAGNMALELVKKIYGKDSAIYNSMKRQIKNDYRSITSRDIRRETSKLTQALVQQIYK